MKRRSLEEHRGQAGAGKKACQASVQRRRGPQVRNPVTPVTQPNTSPANRPSMAKKFQSQGGTFVTGESAYGHRMPCDRMLIEQSVTRKEPSDFSPSVPSLRRTCTSTLTQTPKCQRSQSPTQMHYCKTSPNPRASLSLCN